MDCFVATLLAMTLREPAYPSTIMRALRLHIHRIERLACRHEQPVALLAAEADIGAGFGQADLTDPDTLRREDLHRVITTADPAGADPDIAVGIDSQAVGET